MQRITSNNSENVDEALVNPQTLWQQRLAQGKGWSGLPKALKMVFWLLLLALIVMGVVALYANVPAEGERAVIYDFPKEWSVGWQVMKWIDRIVDWVVVNWDPLFSAINIVVLHYILLPLEKFLLWLPWWLVIVFTGFIAWRVVGAKFALVAAGFLVVISFIGLLDLAMKTLAITLTATLLCVVLGLPIGIAAAKSRRFEGMLRPILDGMQTMPSFVYLIPALMLFGLGRTPAVMATLIYGIPPIIRLTSLGIRQVDRSVVEASNAFGVTPWQLLIKVQIPLALPTILAGLNQTVMMALAMVVLASMIGASGLGVEVLYGISRVEVGRGFLGGISIVFMAIILDRISQGFARKPAE